MILEKVPLPSMMTALGVDNIVKIWREHKVRGKGASFNRAKTLVDAAHDSVGKPGGQGAVMEKYAGFELIENSSGKHKGRTTISKRGRKKLRKIIYQVVLPLIQSNQEFRSIYDYYRKRIKNPLKGRQAMIAVGCKLIRVFFAIMTKSVVFNGSKMIEDIHRPPQLLQAV